MVNQLEQTEVKTVWQTVRAQLELELTRGMFGIWIMPTYLSELTLNQDGATAVIVCPTAFHATNLELKFGVNIKKVFYAVLSCQTTVEYGVGAPLITPQSAPTPTQQVSTATQTDQAFQAVQFVQAAQATQTTQYTQAAQHTQATQDTQAVQSALSSDNHRPINHSSNHSSDPLLSYSTHQLPNSLLSQSSGQSSNHSSGHSSNHSPSPRVEDLFSQTSLAKADANQALVRAKNIGLLADYTFETFAVSGSNEMAYAGATAVSNSPGTAYNPLFLYGGVGVGKTHLMHAIAHNILAHNPLAKIIYCTGEEFTNQIVSAIKNKTTIAFKERYRIIDVLLIDDVQFIAGKNTIQEEFFHTFNALTKRMSQIVLTSDRPPHEISLLESRLRSRFEAGLMIDIQQPSFELRTAILLIKSKPLRIPLTIEMAKTIAARVDSARKMEGVLNSIRSAIQLRGAELNDELIDQALAIEVDQKRPRLNVKIQDVVKTVANHYHLKQAAIKGTSRKKDLAHARHIAMYLCKEDLKEPYAEIGRWFSNRDHTTVMHAVTKVDELLQSEQNVYEEVSALRMSLSGIKQ